MSVSAVVYENKAEDQPFRSVIFASNGKALFRSSERYVRKQDVNRALRQIGVSEITYEDETPA